MIQGVWTKLPGDAGGVWAGDAPEWFSDPFGKIIISILAIGLFIAEVILGFVFIGWWAGVFLWLPFFAVSGAFIPGSVIASKNPVKPFFIGILIVVFAIILFLV